jgi:hypothetical protein
LKQTTIRPSPAVQYLARQSPFARPCADVRGEGLARGTPSHDYRKGVRRQDLPAPRMEDPRVAGRNLNGARTTGRHESLRGSATSFITSGGRQTWVIPPSTARSMPVM